MKKTPIKPIKTISLTDDTFIITTTDREMFNMYLNGPSLKWAIDEFVNDSLRERIKYSDLPEEQNKLLEKILDELFLDLGDLI